MRSYKVWAINECKHFLFLDNFSLIHSIFPMPFLPIIQSLKNWLHHQNGTDAKKKKVFKDGSKEFKVILICKDLKWKYYTHLIRHWVTYTMNWDLSTLLGLRTMSNKAQSCLTEIKKQITTPALYDNYKTSRWK